ncbi:protein ALP1-like isoform X1 [Corylus avellana]|uniref:protein ALP1-like isoform X1 n=1 Tax=Corylus avellana TaxID=13451 RepID=UPI001E222A60|nr:protein ALP1-like isoform X1 [Corylus avellana]XP_059432044.1 protein ALP1-like isoform X1 [Corylus avellana]
MEGSQLQSPNTQADTAMAAGCDGAREPTTTTTTTITKSTAKRKTCQKTRLMHQHQKQKHLLTLISRATSAAHSFLRRHDLRLLPSQILTLESLLSSSFLSISSLLSSSSPSRSLPPQPPQQCWFHRLLSASTQHDPRWSHFFHISKPSFTLLLSFLSPLLSTSLPSVPPDYALASALYRLAHAAPYKAVARRFGLRSAEACRAFYAVCKAVNERLGHLFELRADTDRIVVGFGWISLPNCCGVLGFGRFGVEGQVLGKNGSVMVQALVDSEGRFLDVSAGWPSTMKPEAIFRQSKLYLGVEQSRELLNGPMYKLSDGNSIPQYILGESCFPLLPWLLTPYVRANEEDSFGSSERKFNSVHSRAMGLVCTAFGRVRARWQLLSKRWKEECVEFLPFVIVTGCLLHNFLIKCSEPMPNENLGCLREGEELSVFEGELDESAQRTRDALASHLSRVSIRR